MKEGDGGSVSVLPLSDFDPDGRLKTNALESQLLMEFFLES